jgi:hypothetical protein
MARKRTAEPSLSRGTRSNFRTPSKYVSGVAHGREQVEFRIPSDAGDRQHFQIFSPTFSAAPVSSEKKLQALERTRLPRPKIVEIIDVDVTDSGSCRRGLRTRWVLCPVLSRTAFEIGSDEADVFRQIVAQISNPTGSRKSIGALFEIAEIASGLATPRIGMSCTIDVLTPGRRTKTECQSLDTQDGHQLAGGRTFPAGKPEFLSRRGGKRFPNRGGRTRSLILRKFVESRFSRSTSSQCRQTV